MEHRQLCLYRHAETWVPSHLKDSCPPADSIVSFSVSRQTLVYAILENLGQDKKHVIIPPGTFNLHSSIGLKIISNK